MVKVMCVGDLMPALQVFRSKEYQREKGREFYNITSETSLINL